MIYMLFVVTMYTICSSNDKYAVSKAKYNGSELTFLMAAGTLPFLTLTLPFSDLTFTLKAPTFLFILLATVCKYAEMASIAKVLKEMSVFEVKAWLGITLFASYFVDIFVYGQSFNWLKILCIVITVSGLIMIAKSGKTKVNYKKIALPLIFYLGAKFGYGFIMRAASSYISSTLTLFFALIILAVLMIPVAKPLKIAEKSPEGKKGILLVVLCKLPNALGLLGENALAAQSLTNYSFVQPLLLIVMFIREIFSKKGRPSGVGLIGSIACIVGIIGFQAVGILL